MTGKRGREERVGMREEKGRGVLYWDLGREKR